MSQKLGKHTSKPPNLKFFKLLEDKYLCACNILENYLLRKKSWGVNKQQVLVSFVKPQKVDFLYRLKMEKRILEMASIYTGFLNDN